MAYGNSFQRTTPVVLNLIIINVLVFIGQLALRSPFNLTDTFKLYPILPTGLQNYITASGEEYYGFHLFQVITHMFSHSPNDLFHILFNMIGLWMFGSILGRVWGPKRFLIFYLVCGVGAAALHLGVQYFRAEQLLESLQAGNADAALKYGGALSSALGASGAVMGVMVAFAYLFPNTPLIIIPFPFPVKAKWLVLGYVLIDLFLGVGNAGDKIAHFAHVGGALTGFLIVLYWNKTNRQTFY